MIVEKRQYRIVERFLDRFANPTDAIGMRFEIVATTFEYRLRQIHSSMTFKIGDVVSDEFVTFDFSLLIIHIA
jgi:hypothetical protein